MPQDLIWPPSIDLETPAGVILKKLAATKPPSAEFNRLVIFGSGALQLTVVPGLLSADIDISLDIIPVRASRLSPAKAEETLRRSVWPGLTPGYQQAFHIYSSVTQAWHNYDPSLKTELSKLGKRPSEAKKQPRPSDK